MQAKEILQVNETVLMRRVLRRLIPFVFICYVVSYLDRINIGFAALQMNKQLGISSADFGLAAGLFFIGYFICEIPSNLMLARVGARRWIARIMISWGVVSSLTAFVSGAPGLFVARLLLGMAEAGFVPGIFLFFTYWFPGEWRARATAFFLVGIPVANMIGSPISGALLTMEGHLALHGWQWLCLLEGIPAIVLGLLCLAMLPDRPKTASWLNATERQWLEERLQREQNELAHRHGMRVRDGITPRVLLLGIINFCGIAGSLGVGIWMPQIIRGFGLSYVQTGIVTALPYLAGAIVMVVWARLAERSARSRVYVVGALVAAAVALALSTVVGNRLLEFLALVITVCGILGFTATFWAIPSNLLTGRAAAAGLAVIVSVGNLGGFFGPFAIGVLRQWSGGFQASLLCIAAVMLFGAVLMAAVGDSSAPDAVGIANKGEMPRDQRHENARQLG